MKAQTMPPPALSCCALHQARRAWLRSRRAGSSSFVWLWHFVYPCLLLGAAVLLARAYLPRTRAEWSWELRCGAAALAFTLLYWK